MTHRRSFLKTASTIGLISVSGCLGNVLPGDGGDTIKIGCPLPLSRVFARTGQENRIGLEIAQDHLNGQTLDQDLELLFQDTESEPGTAVQVTQDLIESENVDAIIGPASSASGIAVIEYIKSQGQVPLLPTTVSSMDARENPENCNRYTFFIWPSNRHLVPTGVEFIQTLPEYVDRDIDPSRVHFVSLDYALGQNNLELLEEEMNNVGGEVTGSTLVPQGESDWSSYISEISNSDADVVTGVLTWGSAAQLIPQAESFGLTDSKVMMFNSGKPVGQFAASTIPGDMIGWYGTHFYNPNQDADVNEEFKQLYQDMDSDLLPNSAAGGSFEILRSLSIAMEEAGSTDSDDVISALEGLQWDSIFGSINYRESDHQCMMNFAGAVREDSGSDIPEFTVLEEYPDVIGPAKCN